MRPTDLDGLTWTSSPAVSPDGTGVAFVVHRIDLEANKYRSQIWLGAADGSSPPAPFTSGKHRDSEPRWSPDGTRLAFVSSRGDKEEDSTLHVLRVDGVGETLTLVDHREAIRAPAWSPDGSTIAYTTRTRDERYEEEDPRAQPPRHITRFFTKLDDVGWTMDRPTHVYAVPADSSAPPRNLTPGPDQAQQPAWFPDSQRLVISAARHETWDLDLAIDLYVIDLNGGEPEPLTQQTGQYMLPSVAPDGSAIAFVGVDDPMVYPQNGHIGVVDPETGERRWLTRELDRTWFAYLALQPPVWHDGRLLAVAEDRGAEHLYAMDPLELLVDGERGVSGFDAASGTIAFTAGDITRPPEVYTTIDGIERKLSSVTDAWVEAVKPLPAARFTAGDGEIDTWVYTPPDFDPEGSYPALLNIHGGPFTQYGDHFFDEAQMQAAAGFVVVMSNPRGSSGREEAWGRAIAGAWGTVDYDDVMTAMDEALARYPAIDPERLGVLGGSYGGYMTTWIVSHTDRFAAACSERAANNITGLEINSDIATAFRTWMGVSHIEDEGLYKKMSAITYADQIETPMLLLHSEDDLRCPINQAEELFVALRLAGKPVDFYRFPAEGHELSRSGSPVHRRQRAELILDFFKGHLLPEDEA